MYSRETISPSNGMYTTAQSMIDNTNATDMNSLTRRISKNNGHLPSTDKSANEQVSKQASGVTSPTSNGKIRKRRAPSGVNKIKFVGDKKIKQAIEVISNQNEFLK